MHKSPEVLNQLDDAALVADIAAATQRWLERAVIGLNLCPFAKAVHVKHAKGAHIKKGCKGWGNDDRCV